MKLGVLTNLLGGLSAEKAFKYLAESGVQAIEIGCGGYPGKDHCKPEELLKDESKIAEFVENNVDLRPTAIIEKFGLRRPIYRQLAAYGHVGREDLDIPWEKTDLAEKIKTELL